MSGLVVERTFHMKQGRRSRKALVIGELQPAPAEEKVPRISRLMALAIRFDQLIRDGVVADYAMLAWLGHVSRARITQIMNLLNLAPDIQENLLFLPAPENGRNVAAEHDLRPLAAEADWRKQRRIWEKLSAPLGAAR